MVRVGGSWWELVGVDGVGGGWWRLGRVRVVRVRVVVLRSDALNPPEVRTRVTVVTIVLLPLWVREGSTAL